MKKLTTQFSKSYFIFLGAVTAVLFLYEGIRYAKNADTFPGFGVLLKAWIIAMVVATVAYLCAKMIMRTLKDTESSDPKVRSAAMSIMGAASNSMGTKATGKFTESNSAVNITSEALNLPNQNIKAAGGKED